MNEDWVNDWYLIGATSKVDDRSVSRTTVGPLNLAVFSVHGEYLAAPDACRHCAQSLEGGLVGDDAVECPACGHMLRFESDLTTFDGAGGDCLAIYPIMVVNEDIFAWIEGLA